jgi:hypothetical protein
MKDDYLSAEWAEHHHILTDALYGLLSLLSFGILKRDRAAADQTKDLTQDD